MDSKRRAGIAEILLSGVCFGCLAVFGKLAFERGITPGEFLSLRFLFGGLALAGFFLITKPSRLRVSLKTFVRCAVLGVFGYAVFSSCYFHALRGLSASLTVLLLYTYPVMVAIGAWILFAERIERGKWLALPLVMFGLVLLIWGEMKIMEPGAFLLGLASAFFYALYILASSRWLKSEDPFVAVTYIQLSAGVVLSALYWREMDRFVAVVAGNWLLLSAVALICTNAAMGLFLSGLRKLKNWEVSVLSTSEPVTGIFLSILILRESLSLMQMTGAVAVLAAFLIVAAASGRRRAR
jgi:drug/metabolite transporter, DME family